MKKTSLLLAPLLAATVACGTAKTAQDAHTAESVSGPCHCEPAAVSAAESSPDAKNRQENPCGKEQLAAKELTAAKERYRAIQKSNPAVVASMQRTRDEINSACTVKDPLVDRDELQSNLFFKLANLLPSYELDDCGQSSDFDSCMDNAFNTHLTWSPWVDVYNDTKGGCDRVMQNAQTANLAQTASPGTKPTQQAATQSAQQPGSPIVAKSAPEDSSQKF